MSDLMEPPEYVIDAQQAEAMCCEHCAGSDQQERKQALQAVQDTFDFDWAMAPRQQRNYVDEDCAYYWWSRGRFRGVETLRDDLRQLRKDLV